MKKMTFLLMLMISSLVFSQDQLLGFETTESGGLNGGPFGGGIFTVENGFGTNTTNVLKVVGNTAAGSEIWQGINLNLSTNVNLTTTKTMTMEVFSATPITFLVKATGGIAGAPVAAAAVTHSGNSTWQTLSFTFDTALDGQAAMANGIYQGFVIHTYWASGATTFGSVTADSRTFYVDNIKGPASVAPPIVPPAVPAPTPPARAATDVVSIYSDAYTSVSPVNYDAGWCGAGAVQEIMVTGNPTFAYKDKPCQGIAFPTALQNLTGFTNLHIDLFIASGTDLVGKVFNLKVVPTSGAESEFPIDINALSPAPVPGTWYSYDIPVTFSGPVTSIKEFGITSNLNNVIWYDNLYFHKNTTLGVNDIEATKKNIGVYPNPVVSGEMLTVEAKVKNLEIYNMAGQKVKTSNENTVRTEGLTKGVYVVKAVLENGEVQSTKFIVE